MFLRTGPKYHSKLISKRLISIESLTSVGTYLDNVYWVGKRFVLYEFVSLFTSRPILQGTRIMEFLGDIKVYAVSFEKSRKNGIEFYSLFLKSGVLIKRICCSIQTMGSIGSCYNRTDEPNISHDLLCIGANLQLICRNRWVRWIRFVPEFIFLRNDVKKVPRKNLKLNK